jgi:hypothetical protein
MEEDKFVQAMHKVLVDNVGKGRETPAFDEAKEDQEIA